MPKSWELEQRVARLEIELLELHTTLDTVNKRTVALQAQLDHLLARLAVS
jgi:hypothetical protein